MQERGTARSSIAANSVGSRTFRCGNCGGHVPTEGTAGIAYCRYCGTQLDLQGARYEISQYEASAAQWLEGAEEYKAEEHKAEEYKEEVKEEESGWAKLGYTLFASIWISVWLWSLPIVYALLVTFGVPILLGLYFKRRSNSEEKDNRELATTTVACPNCGAPGKLTQGQGVDTCSYCGAALARTRTEMRQSLDELQRDFKSAKLKHQRRERRRALARGDTGSGGSDVVEVVALVVGMLLIAFVLLIGPHVSPSGIRPLPGLIVLIGMLIVLGSRVLFLAYKYSKQKRTIRSLNALATSLHGQPMHSLADWVRWLNKNWAGDYGASEVYQNYVAGAVTFSAAGRPALLVYDAGDKQKGKLHILVASAATGSCPSNSISRIDNLDLSALQVKDELNRMGYDIKVNEAGVAARASSAVVKQITKRPEMLQELGQVIAKLAHIADNASRPPSRQAQAQAPQLQVQAPRYPFW